MASFVLTLIGDDRPGLVGRLAEVVAHHRGNWLESRMAHLGGQFAGILRVDVADDDVRPLLGALGDLEAEGLTLVVERTDDGDEDDEYLHARLDIVGNDRPGIVAEISRELAAQRINVEELTTECSSAPMSGESIFRASGRLRLPAGLSLDALRQNLERIGHDLFVEVTLAIDQSN